MPWTLNMVELASEIDGIARGINCCKLDAPVFATWNLYANFCVIFPKIISFNCG